MPKDLHELPLLRDSLSYIYIEHAIIEQEDMAIVFIQKDNRTPVPIASITVLLIGPGTSITHAAMKAICDNGSMVVWVGEQGTRFYSAGIGETRSAANLLKQAKLCMDKDLHLEVVKRMYQFRFPGISCDGMTLAQIRGLEGVRVRETYKIHSKISGIKWTGRVYKKDDWNNADPLNRALSAGNACLYGICHAAIVSLGYSTGLGFVHTGKVLSFVYDIADLYKAKTTIPAAFEVAAKKDVTNVEREARITCRKYFKDKKILKSIAGDIAHIFDIQLNGDDLNPIEDIGLWDGEDEVIADGINYSSNFTILEE